MLSTFSWQQITLSWAPDTDLDVYINGVLKGHSLPGPDGSFDPHKEHHFVIGSASSLTGLGLSHTVPLVDVDELKYWSLKRTGRDIWCMYAQVAVEFGWWHRRLSRIFIIIMRSHEEQRTKVHIAYMKNALNVTKFGSNICLCSKPGHFSIHDYVTI